MNSYIRGVNIAQVYAIERNSCNYIERDSARVELIVIDKRKSRFLHKLQRGIEETFSSVAQ